MICIVLHDMDVHVNHLAVLKSRSTRSNESIDRMTKFIGKFEVRYSDKTALKMNDTNVNLLKIG